MTSVLGSGTTAAPTSAPSPPPDSGVRPLIAIGHVPGCVDSGADPVPYLENYDADILRVVIGPSAGEDGESLSCVTDAVSAGYKVSLVISYDNSWSSGEIVTYFEKVLSIYGQDAWSVSVGNEQELNQNGSQTASQYASTWQAVEPIIASECPQAIRVAGEISPWGLQFLQSALAIGLPGAEAIAGHPYARAYAFAPAHFAALADVHGLKAWYSEALAAPNSWGASIPLSSMPDASMAGIWLN